MANDVDSELGIKLRLMYDTLEGELNIHLGTGERLLCREALQQQGCSYRNIRNRSVLIARMYSLERKL